MLCTLTSPVLWKVHFQFWWIFNYDSNVRYILMCFDQCSCSWYLIRILPSTLPSPNSLFDLSPLSRLMVHTTSFRPWKESLAIDYPLLYHCSTFTHCADNICSTFIYTCTVHSFTSIYIYTCIRELYAHCHGNCIHVHVHETPPPSGGRDGTMLGTLHWTNELHAGGPQGRPCS